MKGYPDLSTPLKCHSPASFNQSNYRSKALHEGGLMPEVEFALIYASLTAQIAGDSNLRILRIRTVVSAKKKCWERSKSQTSSLNSPWANADKCNINCDKYLAYELKEFPCVS